MRTPSSSNIILVASLLLLALLPVFALLGINDFYLDLATRSMIFAIAAYSLNLILGYAGLVSLGHAAYLLLGAYSVALPNYYGIGNGWLHLLLAMVSGGLFALITGAISLRTQAAGFIMITLAFSQMVYFLFISLETYGGSDGLTIDFSSDFGLFSLGDSSPLYYTVLVSLGACVWLIQRLLASRFGYALNASRMNPKRLRALGLSPYRIQLTAYIIAGVVCAIAGFLLANFTRFITPEMMDWFRSAELIFMVALGGAATLAGPLLGAFSFITLEHFLSELSTYWQLPFGIFLIAIAMYKWGGLAQLIDKISPRR